MRHKEGAALGGSGPDTITVIPCDEDDHHQHSQISPLEELEQLIGWLDAIISDEDRRAA